MTSLAELLETKPILLADGATGTNLFQMGLEAGDPPEEWNITHPERIEALHQSFVDAGADIILTNTFGGNARRLKLHKLDGRVREINAAAARIARKVADAAGRPVVVAGSVGPTGDLFSPLGELTHEVAVAVFREQMEGLAEGGADVMWIETMSAAEEMNAACEAARSLGLPHTVTASFDTAGRTMMGLEPGTLGGALPSGEDAPLAIGANCGVGASDLLVSILAMTEADPDRIVIAKANCGVPQVKGGEVVYTGTPELMARFAHLAADAGARIVGGCCGTTAGHLAGMRKALDEHTPGPRPDRAAIEAATGPLVAPPADAAQGSDRRRGRRGRG
ncbi:MAG: betaine--homocysteine S-methyltransferase [Rhizobiales bacterium]|nr:betaine--homocysteine S-methyltransferase [Hyphomicrobiales bacterium]